jgi:hypothetical protein
MTDSRIGDRSALKSALRKALDQLSTGVSSKHVLLGLPRAARRRTLRPQPPPAPYGPSCNAAALRPRRCPALLAPPRSHTRRQRQVVVPRARARYAARRAAEARSSGCPPPAAQQARRRRRADCRALGEAPALRLCAAGRGGSSGRCRRALRGRVGTASGPGPRLRPKTSAARARPSPDGRDVKVRAGLPRTAAPPGPAPMRTSHATHATPRPRPPLRPSGRRWSRH